MNGEKFEEWTREVLIPKLPPRSVVVMDNASYHSVVTDESKCPTQKTRKDDIKDWLRQKCKHYFQINAIWYYNMGF